MTLAGWTLLVCSWGVILTSLGFCFARILRGGDKKR